MALKKTTTETDIAQADIEAATLNVASILAQMPADIRGQLTNPKTNETYIGAPDGEKSFLGPNGWQLPETVVVHHGKVVQTIVPKV